MVLDISLLVLAVAGQEQLWNLRGPIQRRDYAIFRVMVVEELDCWRQDVLASCLCSADIIRQEQL